MKYIIMAGGHYRTWETPRHLLPFMGEPIIARTIRLLRENGIEDIAISSDNEVFEQFGVPVLRHENSYDTWKYNECEGHWCDCFYPTNEPTCYIFGDVVFSENAIRTIVQKETDDIAFFGSASPFARCYPKCWIEPFAFKVTNTDHLHRAIEDVKRLEAEGRFGRKPIAWEVWNVIHRGPDGDVNTVGGDYDIINDWTCDIDKPEEVGILEFLAMEAMKESPHA